MGTVAIQRDILTMYIYIYTYIIYIYIYNVIYIYSIFHNEQNHDMGLIYVPSIIVELHPQDSKMPGSGGFTVTRSDCWE